ncbi:MAG: DUF1080 domain-containing protein [bacterium]|nr:DUF1080 domain-containing protein [bacterium]
MTAKRLTRSVMTVLFLSAFSICALAQPHKLVPAQSGSGIVGYKDTPIQPWSGYHVHDPDRPEPPRVEPGDQPTMPPPSDAIVLFDGKDMARWTPAPDWKIEDGCLIAGTGNLTTKESFGDCQLHMEWATPDPPQGEPMNRGNNGVLMLGLFEIQIFDTYTQKLYPDGQAGAIYGQTPPLVDVSRKPGQWQNYDIIVTAPVLKNDEVASPARVTLIYNGVVAHLNQEVYGDTPHARLASYANAKSTGPIALMGHHNPVRFRNIWIRRLNLARKTAE